MDNICSTAYWDNSVTWDTATPVLTPCFLKVALVWGPVVFFWIFAPIEFYTLSRKKGSTIPWSPLNVLKLIAALCMLCVAIADTVYQMIKYKKVYVPPVDYYTPFLIAITMVAVTVMLLVQRRKGQITSGLLFLFWFFLTVGTAGAYYTAMQKTFNKVFEFDQHFDRYDFFLFVTYFSLSIVQLILTSFADFKVKSNKIPKRENPEDRASFLSKLTFWWFNPMAVLGYKKPLNSYDMWKLSEENQSEYLQTEFEKYWLPLVHKVKSHYDRVKLSLSRKYSDRYTSESIEALNPEELKAVPKLSIMGPVLRVFGWDLLFTALLKLGASVVTFINPMILNELIAFVGGSEPLWKGLLFAAGMFLSAMVESFLNGQYEYKVYSVAMRIRSCIISIIYKKALLLSNSARKDFTVGEVVNLMSVDTQRVMDYVQMVNLLWSAPLQICIAIYLLWQQLGIATLGGLLLMISFIPLNGWISILLRNYQVSLMKHKDTRTKVMNEVIDGIKVLKLYAWEPSFLKEVLNIRGREVSSLRSQAYLNGILVFIFSCAPFLVALASFATFVLIDDNNILDANKAFVSLSLFNILRIPTAMLPIIIAYTAMFLVSLKRINKYLQGDEIDPNAIDHNPAEEDAIIIEDGTFSWSQGEPPALREIELRVSPGQLVAVVGQVGCGKSSLLAALLGDMIKWNGRVNVKGSVAYVPQQAWIRNETLRKNVLFMKSYNEQRYKAVIEACALAPDLQILPGGDQTEIGEKGINLSGGQKQRVSLARAVYNNADIYFLDDPLSAVDAHVGKHIFQHVIGPEGLLKNKTRIFATHRIGVLPEVDKIIVLQDGMISEAGSYKELLAQKGAFANLLLHHLQEGGDEESLPDEIIDDVEQAVGSTSAGLGRRISRIEDLGSDSDTVHQRRRGFSESNEGVRRRHTSFTDSRVEDKLKRESKKHSIVGTKLTEVETMEVGSVSGSVYLDYTKSYGVWNAIVTVFCFAVCMGLGLGSNLWLSAWSNDALDPESAGDLHLRDVRLGVYAAFGAGEVIFTLIHAILLNLACLRASRILHDSMLERILRAPASFFDVTPVGRILNRFSKDVDTVDVILRSNVRMVLIMGFAALEAVIIISMETPIFLAALVPLGVLYYFLQKFYIPTSRQLKRLESTTRSPVYSHFSETVTGATSIRAYCAQQRFLDTSNHLVDVNNESYQPSLAASRWLSIRLEFLGYTVVLLAALLAVLGRNTLSPGIAGLSVSYALEFTGVLNMLVKATADVETNIVAVERCIEYTKTPTEADWDNKRNKPAPTWPEEGGIHFNNYSTRYRPGLELVLKKISCQIIAGEKCGIVGRTGAGKSSLTLALFRLVEAAGGKILIDGVDIGNLGLHDLRSKLTIIPQDPVLFSGTLRSNLDPFGLYSDSSLWKALEHSHLKSFVKSLEQGLEHEVAEGGENLSVGQRQLVCLARALLRKSQVLVLDEATAAVDVETDDLIQKTIRTEFSECTVLTIAHRLNTIMDYDKVIVLSKGEILEMDKPENLLKKENSEFYSMAKDAGLI